MTFEGLPMVIQGYSLAASSVLRRGAWKCKSLFPARRTWAAAGVAAPVSAFSICPPVGADSRLESPKTLMTTQVWGD